MTKKLLCLFFLLVFCLCKGQAQDTTATIKEQHAPEMASFVVIVPVTEFREDNLRKLANEYLGRSQTVKLLNVGMFTERAPAYDSLGKTTYHISYDVWKEEFEKRAQDKSERAAVLLKCGNSATLRIRNLNGEIEEIKIAGENAFHPTVAGVALDILHVSFVDQGFGDARELTAHFYVKVPKRITPKEASELAKSFFDTLGLSNVTLHLREDDLFIFDPFYPWMNPFTKSETPPSLKDTARSAQFLCSPRQEGTCFQSALGSK